MAATPGPPPEPWVYGPAGWAPGPPDSAPPLARFAAMGNYEAVSRALLDYKAKELLLLGTEPLTVSGFALNLTPLHAAVMRAMEIRIRPTAGYIEDERRLREVLAIIRALLKYDSTGINVQILPFDPRNGFSGHTALTLAVAGGADLSVVEELLKVPEINPAKRICYGLTALHCACLSKSRSGYFFGRLPRNTDLHDVHLMIALLKHPGMRTALINKGTREPFHLIAAGSTPLMLAARFEPGGYHGRHKFETLLKFGADLDRVDGRGRKALDIMATCNSPAVAHWTPECILRTQAKGIGEYPEGRLTELTDGRFLESPRFNAEHVHSALQGAIAGNNIGVIDHVAAHMGKAPFLVRNEYTQDTLLHDCADSGLHYQDDAIFRKIAEKAPELLRDPFIQNVHGETPLHTMAGEPQGYSAECLVSAMVELNPEVLSMKENSGMTAEALALEYEASPSTLRAIREAAGGGAPALGAMELLSSFIDSC